MARRSSLWSEIARDRELRRKAAAQQERFARQIASEQAQEELRERAAKDRAAKASAKEQAERQRQDNLATAAEQTERLNARSRELSELLIECVCQPVFTVADLIHPVTPPFDPGADDCPEPEPLPPVVNEGGLFGRGRRRREAAAAQASYEEALAAHRQRDHDRQCRLEQRRAEYQRTLRQVHDGAQRRAAETLESMVAGDEQTVELFATAAINALNLPEGIVLDPHVAYRPDPLELVIDVKLPGLDVVPAEKSVRYIHSRGVFDAKPRSQAEIRQLYLKLIAQLPLSILHALFNANDADVVDSVVINGALDTRDPATGQPVTDYLVSVTTSRASFDELILDEPELNPVRCLRHLGAKLSRHPHDVEGIQPFLTFDEAKYRLASSVDVAAALDATTNLLEIDWADFEQLVRQLLQAMNGGDARVTRRSRDDGIDGVLFDCNAVMGGEYVVQVKKYRNVVPANDVRALAGVMHDKRANHAVFVTPSWFSDDGRRFAANNRIRLIEGPELKQLLHDHLDLEVIIPRSRSRRVK